MEHYGVPLPPLEYGPAFTAGERVLKSDKPDLLVCFSGPLLFETKARYP